MRAADIRTHEPSGRTVINPATVRLAGPGGRFEGTCIACLEPADTAVVLAGCVSFLVAVLEIWGITSQENARATLLSGLDDMRSLRVLKDGQGRVTSLLMPFRVCANCAGRARMVPRLLIGDAELPVYDERNLPGYDECDHPVLLEPGS
jgi:hypothetical protein